jgi:ribose-phosphate pyrophosphokinase
MIKIYAVQGGEIPYEQFIFPGGEVSIRLDVSAMQYVKQFTIHANLQSPTEIINLVMIEDAIRRQVPEALIELYMPYVPYARQDRVSIPGEAFSIKAFAALINSMHFFKVTAMDVHSQVTEDSIDRLEVIPQWHLVNQFIGWRSDYVLIAPDKGAVEKTAACARTLDLEYITASKVRDPVTGKITGTEVNFGTAYLKGKRLLIVDDICDGGRTFTELAKAIRAQVNNPIDLYVTHGIFSKGLNELYSLFETIYCANPWFEDERITTI